MAGGAVQTNDGIAAPPPPARGANQLPWLPATFAAVLVLSLVMAFVRLGGASYWTDELFTLFLVDHDGGPAEVMRRVLTDTHPPFYYFVLYGWSKLSGLSEGPMRLSSALLATAAVGVFFAGTRREFSFAGRAFACALATTANFWFDQSQNIRNYPLAMLVSAGLLAAALAARRRVLAGASPLGAGLALTILGLAGAMTHFYVFLEVGLVYLWLVATLPSTPLRVGLVASGLVIAAVELAFMHALLATTQQNIHHMWFRADALFFFNQVTVAWHNAASYAGLAAAAVMARIAWKRRGQGVPAAAGSGWAMGLCVFVHIAMCVLGIAISLVLAPSISSINLGTAAPMLWGILAWLYDRGGPDRATRRAATGGALLIAVLATHLPILAGRFLPRREDWRGSASFVASQPGCGGQPIPVVLAQYFGPPTPFFHTLAERWMYGHYLPDPGRLRAYQAAELTGAIPAPGLGPQLAARAHDASACRVLAWAVHDMTPESARALADGIARRPDVAPAKVRVVEFAEVQHEEWGYSPVVTTFVLLAER